MKKLPIKTILIGIVVIIVLFVVWSLVKPEKKPTSALVSSQGGVERPAAPAARTETAATSDVGNELLIILTRLERLKLDDSILYNAAFRELRDISIPLVREGNEGRRNPFALLGVDPLVTGTVQEVTSGIIEGTLSSSTTCTSETCFASKFTACEPALYVAKSGSGAATGTPSIEYQYKILGTTTGGCTLETEFLSHTDPGITGKSMTCTYDNKKPFTEAVNLGTPELRAKLAPHCAGTLKTLILSS